MAKYHQKNQVSDEVIDQSNKIAKSIQKPGQTKEQTKLVAQGIQKGIEQYKKQHKVKTREQDKLRKKRQADVIEVAEPPSLELAPKVSVLPWSLLIISWLGFAAYIIIGS